MKVVILHNRVPKEASQDDLDTLIQAKFIARLLKELGHGVKLRSMALDIKATLKALRNDAPDLVFNIVESVEGHGRLIHIAPTFLDYLGIPYTGVRTEAVFVCNNKLWAKKILSASGLKTAPWIARGMKKEEMDFRPGRYIVKSVWEHASVGVEEDSVITAQTPDEVLAEMARRRVELRGEAFAEVFIEGREFNLSILAGPDGPQVLPPGEIIFENFPEDKLKLVGYRAKWVEESFEYENTPRTFDFTARDEPLLKRLQEIALTCWRLFELRGYARVDFRVDNQGTPFILEVNANPCIAPDAGFIAAAERAGLAPHEVIERIVNDALRP